MTGIAAFIISIYLGVQIDNIGYRKLLNTFYWKEKK